MDIRLRSSLDLQGYLYSRPLPAGLPGTSAATVRVSPAWATKLKKSVSEVPQRLPRPKPERRPEPAGSSGSGAEAEPESGVAVARVSSDRPSSTYGDRLASVKVRT